MSLEAEKAVKRQGLPFSLFLHYASAEPCLPLAPQLFMKGESFSLPLTFFAPLLKNKGLYLEETPRTWEQRPSRASMFCGGRQAAAPVHGKAWGACEEL